MNEIQMEPFIQTYSGKKMYFLDPKPEMIELVDIAHALSNICRFSGHTHRFYSVLEHTMHMADAYTLYLQGKGIKSVFEMRVEEVNTLLWMLLHDGTEAYVTDVPRPIKPYLKGYKEIEDRICEKFGMPKKAPDIVKEYDNAILMNEKNALLHPGVEWGWEVRPLYGVFISQNSESIAVKLLRRAEFVKLVEDCIKRRDELNQSND
jgi:hypothetical protein